MTLVDRFLQYVKFDTQSDELTNLTPSTPGQMIFAQHLEKELHQLGLKDISLDDNGYLMATLPSNSKTDNIPTVGFIAHLDTSPDLTGRHVAPRIVEHYNGGDIVLNAEKNIVLSPSEFPELEHYKGQDLIVTDGNTLLGADDKAGIAEIMAAVELLEGRPHGEVRVVFTTDEEIGCGVDGLDVAELACDYGYTVDGGPLGEIEYENFNAAAATVKVRGLNIHPGSAKNKMKNAALLLAEFIGLLPAAETPAHTEGYEGFFHLCEMSGDESSAEAAYIIRDHNREKFETRKVLMQQTADFMNQKYGAGTFTLHMTDSYYNMKEKLTDHMYLIHNAEAAMQKAGVTPKIVAIRGGTDGARLSYEGLPCPNLSTGGLNFHSIHEFIPVRSLEKMVEVLRNLVTL